MTALFWTSAFCVLYTYIGYPVLMFWIARLFPRPHRVFEDGTEFPSVSLIIAAYNEERVIGEKIRNSLALDYPREKLEIIVVSDGSNDGTPDIVLGHAGEGVVSLHLPERRGKTAALNRAVSLARGEIVVFSDANTNYNPESIRKLVRSFAEPEVGGVCGRKGILSSDDRQSSSGDSLYWKYESFLKKLESDVGSITTADGEIFAMRKALYERIDEDVINDDAELTFRIVTAGYRIIYDTEALSLEPASITLQDDFHVKARMVAGGYQTVSRYSRYLFFSFQSFALQFLSHKLLRWLAPLFLCAVFVSSAYISARSFYRSIFLTQCVFYVCAAIGYRRVKTGRKAGVFYAPLYFSVMNLAAFVGLYRFLARRQSSAWRKAQR